MWLKVTYGGVTRKLSIAPDAVSWDQLSSLVQQRFLLDSLSPMSKNEIVLVHVDEEGDEISISSTEELQELIESVSTSATITASIRLSLRSAAMTPAARSISQMQSSEVSRSPSRTASLFSNSDFEEIGPNETEGEYETDSCDTASIDEDEDALDVAEGESDSFNGTISLTGEKDGSVSQAGKSSSTDDDLVSIPASTAPSSTPSARSSLSTASPVDTLPAAPLESLAILLDSALSEFSSTLTESAHLLRIHNPSQEQAEELARTIVELTITVVQFVVSSLDCDVEPEGLTGQVERTIWSRLRSMADEHNHESSYNETGRSERMDASLEADGQKKEEMDAGSTSAVPRYESPDWYEGVQQLRYGLRQSAIRVGMRTSQGRIVIREQAPIALGAVVECLHRVEQQRRVGWATSKQTLGYVGAAFRRGFDEFVSHHTKDMHC